MRPSPAAGSLKTSSIHEPRAWPSACRRTARWCRNSGTLKFATRCSARELRGRTTARGLSERMRALRQLPVTTDAEPNLDPVITIARSHRLSIYDAVYLELARRRRAVLATLDSRLAHAAAAEDVADRRVSRLRRRMCETRCTFTGRADA